MPVLYPSDQLADFFHTALVTTTLELGVEVLIDNLQGSFLTDETGGHGEDVAIVVLTAKMGDFGSPAKGTTDMGILVDSHLDTVAAAADDNAALVFPLVDGIAHLMGEIGVIATIGTVCSIVFYIKTLCFEMVDDFQLQLVACMVARYRNNFFHFSECL